MTDDAERILTLVRPRRDCADLRARSDDELMLLASGGQKDAFRILVERHAKRVVRFCFRMVGDLRAAEDLAQETWLAVWNARAAYRPDGRFTVWLFVSARNRCLNARRGAARSADVFVADGGATESAAAGAGADPSQLERLLDVERQRRLQAAIDELPIALREAVTLRFAESLAYDDIAAATSSNASTVRSRVFHGLKKLAARLHDDPSPRSTR